MKANWQASFTTTRGGRKQFKAWSIPAEIQRHHGIKDGMMVRILATANGLVIDDVFKVTSGGEFLLSIRDAEKIQFISNSNTDGIVRFELEDAPLEAVFSDLDESVSRSLCNDAEQRRQRLALAPKIPASYTVTATAFVRNPDVVAEVLERASGSCEECGNSAPFNRRTNGLPYLEVHHIHPLAQGGEDTVANAKALCPNCHRKAHFG